MGPYLLDSGCAGDALSSLEGAGVCACPIRARICVCVCACVRACVYVCVYACVRVDVCVCARAHTRAWVRRCLCVTIFRPYPGDRQKTAALITKQVTCQTSNKETLSMTSADTSLLRHKRSLWRRVTFLGWSVGVVTSSGLITDCL